MLTAPGERRIVGGFEVEAHHPEQGVPGILRPGAAGDGRAAAESGRSRWRDPSSAAAPPRRPLRPGVQASDRLRGQPHRHIAASNEGLVIGRPVRNAVLRLIRGMNLRLHSRSVAPAEGPREVRATPPHRQRVFMQQRHSVGGSRVRPRACGMQHGQAIRLVEVRCDLGEPTRGRARRAIDPCATVYLAHMRPGL